jgi:hypothetical protein
MCLLTRTRRSAGNRWRRPRSPWRPSLPTLLGQISWGWIPEPVARRQGRQAGPRCTTVLECQQPPRRGEELRARLRPLCGRSEAALSPMGPPTATPAVDRTTRPSGTIERVPGSESRERRYRRTRIGAGLGFVPESKLASISGPIRRTRAGCQVVPSMHEPSVRQGKGADARYVPGLRHANDPEANAAGADRRVVATDRASDEGRVPERVRRAEGRRVANDNLSVAGSCSNARGALVFRKLLR